MSDELALVRALHRDDDFDANILSRAKENFMASIDSPEARDRTERVPRIIPHLIYDDVAGAIDWLTRAFGFREREAGRILEPDGAIGHAELDVHDALIMLGPPSVHGGSPERGVSTMLQVYVDHVDDHCQRARDAGAIIVLEPADQPWGERRYQVEDLEGHQWSFAQRIP